MSDSPQTQRDVAFVPYPEVEQWQRAGWRVSGILPGTHARYSCLMERNADDG